MPFSKGRSKAGLLNAVLQTPRFLLDLAEELTWLNEKAGANIAAAWYRSLKTTIRQLERHPLPGRERRDLSPPGIRTWRVMDYPRWLIFYGIDEGGKIVLYRIRQGTMNLVVLKMES
jgi:plasmid stabilization system protein ParE